MDHNLIAVLSYVSRTVQTTTKGSLRSRDHLDADIKLE